LQAELRKAEDELRQRLFVCQVAKRYGWEDANKMARRKGGEYDDPELAKVLEEREKKEEKAKRDRAKSAGSGGAKRGRFASSLGTSKGSGYVARQNNSPLAAVDQSSSRSRGGYARRPQAQASSDLKCYVCGGFGHYFRHCPDRKT
jgi:hypothetical protein